MKILVIDDEKSIRMALKMHLQKQGAEVVTAETGEEGLALFQAEGPDLVVLDIKLPGMDGIEVLKRIKQIEKDAIVIMVTYLSEIKLVVEAMKLGAYDYFAKPFSLTDIGDAVEKTMEYVKVRRELSDKPAGNNALIGNSTAIVKIRETIRQLGKMDFHTSVLIQGESGTGKEIVARMIYNARPRRKDSFMAINCAAVAQSLLESELFGYQKGAFTDAKQNKPGLLELAGGGVLFLDEVADMDLSMQAKLLRVLQEKKFRRLGGLEELEIDTTVVAATNKKLEVEIERGNFRKDLFYRLNVVPIFLPPLRERGEDISYLANYFVGQYNHWLNKGIVGWDADAMDALKRYDWPGNVRELKNAIERIMIFKKNGAVSFEDIPEEIAARQLEEEELCSGTNLSAVYEEAIRNALENNNWNITRTSNELGISRLTLRRKMQKYNIVR